MNHTRKACLAVLTTVSVAAMGTASAAASTSSSGNARPATAAALYSVTDLGALGTGNLSVANAVNNAGVVVGYTDVTPGLPRAFRWSAGTMTDLGVEPGGGSSVANAVNDAGQVAGTADRQSGGYGYPVRWSAAGALVKAAIDADPAMGERVTERQLRAALGS